MNTTTSTKLAALGLALFFNSIIMGSVALAFTSHAHQASLRAVASVVAPSTRNPA